MALRLRSSGFAGVRTGLGACDAADLAEGLCDDIQPDFTVTGTGTPVYSGIPGYNAPPVVATTLPGNPPTTGSALDLSALFKLWGLNTPTTPIPQIPTSTNAPPTAQPPCSLSNLNACGRDVTAWVSKNSTLAAGLFVGLIVLSTLGGRRGRK